MTQEEKEMDKVLNRMLIAAVIMTLLLTITMLAIINAMAS